MTIHSLNEARIKRFPEQERWLTTREIAQYLGFSTKWVLRQVRLGMPVAIMGARYRFKITEVEAWLRAQATSA